MVSHHGKKLPALQHDHRGQALKTIHVQQMCLYILTLAFVIMTVAYWLK